MKIGYFGLNVGFDNAESIVRLVKTAENAGFESVWTGEHVVLLDPVRPPSVYPPRVPFVDTIATLAFCAAHTETIKLGTGLVVATIRNPLVLAKELAGVDVLSGGRLIAGLGIGYVEEEYEALGVPWRQRGARCAEYIEVLRTLWTEDEPAFDGEFASFSGVQSRPQPLQRPHPPIHIGGHSKGALRRAVRQANGWYGTYLDPEGASEFIDQLKQLGGEVDRGEGLGELEVSITPSIPVDKDVVRRFEDLGVERLIIMRDFGEQISNWGSESEESVIRFLEESAERIGLGG